MSHQLERKNNIIGIGLATAAALIWAGNYVIARGVHQLIGPVSLAFFRWSTATLIITPFAWPSFKKERQFIRPNLTYLFWVALTGITLFNTFIYISGHFTTAINMALIGTTSAPIFATILAILFLHEKMNLPKFIGIIFCFSGILILLSRGSFETLLSFRFGTGDLWVLAAGLFFAIYSVLVRKKPAALSSLHFLMLIFGIGTFLLFPFFIIENRFFSQPHFSPSLIGIICYLGLGTSVVSFLCWNIALQKLGTTKTVLFGNLIPLFSAIEAMIFLGEQISFVHIFSGLLVISGLIIANVTSFSNRKKMPTHL